MKLRHNKLISLWCTRTILIFWILFCSTLIEAQEEQMIHDEQQLLAHPDLVPLLLGKGEIGLSQIPNPHWRDDGCIACHDNKPNKEGLHLRESYTDAMCNNCHDFVPLGEFHHPSAIKLPNSMRSRMPRSFQQSVKKNKGEVTCITCHELSIQCQPKSIQDHGLNPSFFREGPYRTRDEICYRCHKESAYTRLNPHRQINQDGTRNEQICGVCHQEIEKLSSAKSIRDVAFNVEDNLNNMCTGCHPWQPHPGGGSFFGVKHEQPPNHLVAPSQKVLRRMTETENKNSIILPLEPKNGKVFCGTCHNPHAKNVIDVPQAATGSDSKNRLRAQKMCDKCHDL